MSNIILSSDSIRENRTEVGIGDLTVRDDEGTELTGYEIRIEDVNGHFYYDSISYL
jgi:hypothetical protein